MNESNFISIDKSSKLVGRSEKTIRRFVKKNEGSQYIKKETIGSYTEKTTGEIKELFTWFIDMDFLIDRYGLKTPPDPSPIKDKPKNEAKRGDTPQEGRGDTVTMPREIWDSLMTEIKEKNKQLSDFNERWKEANIMLSQQLLTAPKQYEKEKFEEGTADDRSN